MTSQPGVRNPIPFNASRAAAQEWQLVWRTATPSNLEELEEIKDPKGVKLVEQAVDRYFQDGFKNGEYKFWYFQGEGRRFTKVIVSKGQPNYDMIREGEWPALGTVLFREEDENVANIWKDLASQVVEKGEG